MSAGIGPPNRSSSGERINADPSLPAPKSPQRRLQLSCSPSPSSSGNSTPQAVGSPPLVHLPAKALKTLYTSKDSVSAKGSPLLKRRTQTHSSGNKPTIPTLNMEPPSSPSNETGRASLPPASPRSPPGRQMSLQDSLAKAKSRDAQRVNDSMVYLDGPQVYTCAQCRTHLTSHDDIISKSFHGRHGRAYLFDQCVNVTMGPVEERRLITGLHTVCDIFCKRCKTLVGWTYEKAYEAAQKYKEGKFIIEKINLHLEESDSYDVAPPAGERSDRWRRRSMSWGDSNNIDAAASMIFEYQPSSP